MLTMLTLSREAHTGFFFWFRFPGRLPRCGLVVATCRSSVVKASTLQWKILCHDTDSYFTEPGVTTRIWGEEEEEEQEEEMKQESDS